MCVTALVDIFAIGILSVLFVSVWLAVCCCFQDIDTVVLWPRPGHESSLSLHAAVSPKRITVGIAVYATSSLQ